MMKGLLYEALSFLYKKQSICKPHKRILKGERRKQRKIKDFEYLTKIV
jgi:hypothetical protein